MRILVTGSTGTLGPFLVEELRKRGHDVYGLGLQHSGDSRYIRADVSVYNQFERAFIYFKPELVYHLAAEFGRVNGKDYPEQLWHSNQIGTINCIKLCLKYNAKMVLAGSSEAYGDSSPDCQYEGWLDDHVPPFHNEYALSKWVQERQVLIAARNHGLKAVLLRFFNAYGPGEVYSPYRSVVCLFCYRMLHGLPITVYKNYKRVFMYVEDWAQTVANVADRFDSLPAGSNHAGVPVYNIGGSEYKNVEDVVTQINEKITKLTGYPSASKITLLEQEAANVTNKQPNLEAAMRDLSHNPKTLLDVGLDKTLEWMLTYYK
jgi:dTDP-glucose 4,6-dehydratase